MVIKNSILVLLFLAIIYVDCKNEPRTPLFPKGVQPVLTGYEVSPEKLSSSHCKSCHKETHSQWEKSLHSKAWTDPIFQEAFKIEKMEWCINCHAPLNSQKQEYLKQKTQSGYSLLDEGINCAACHVREGKVLGSKNLKLEAHEVIDFPYLKTSEFCENCHQFNFPIFKNKQIHYSTEPMQNTYAEWKNLNSDKTCQSCHYEEHELIGPSHREWMKDLFSNFSVEEVKKGILSISFELDSRRAHTIPSGDLFHSLSFQASLKKDFSILIFEKKWARFYRIAKNKDGIFWDRDLKRNTGILGSETKINLSFDIPENKKVHLRLVYFYHDEHLGGKTNLSKEQRELVIWEN